MDWKYKTNENGITLHDHEITEWIFGEDDIMLIFEEGFDVFKDCGINQTGRHKQTGKSVVILKKGRFVSGELSSGQDIKVISQDDLPDLELEVLDFKRLSDSVIFECDAWSRKGGKDIGFCEVEFSCEDVLFCWNEFTCDAWFQDWPK